MGEEKTTDLELFVNLAFAIYSSSACWRNRGRDCQLHLCSYTSLVQGLSGSHEDFPTGTFLGILLFLSLSSPSPVFQSIAMFYTGDLRFISYDIGGILNLIPKQAAGESSQLPG